MDWKRFTNATCPTKSRPLTNGFFCGYSLKISHLHRENMTEINTHYSMNIARNCKLHRYLQGYKQWIHWDFLRYVWKHFVSYSKLHLFISLFAWKLLHLKCIRVSQMKTLSIFYLVTYWIQKVHNDFIFLCSLHCVPYKCSSASEVHGYL